MSYNTKLIVFHFVDQFIQGLIMEVRGICTSPAPNVYEGGRVSCSVDVVAVGSALKLLAANGESVITEFSDLSRELLWLRCDDYPYTSIPSHFSMQKLRVLELLDEYNDLESLWQSDEQVHCVLVITVCDPKFPCSCYLL